MKKPISNQEINDFIIKKNRIEKLLSKKTGFIFYSINGVSKDQEEKLWKNMIMLADT